MIPIQELKNIENIVIGYLLNNNDLYTANLDVFSNEVFNDHNCDLVHKAIRKLYNEGKPIDIICIGEETGLDFSELSSMFQAVDYNVDFKNAINTIINCKTEIEFTKIISNSANRISQGDDIQVILSDLKNFIERETTRNVQRITPIKEHISNLVEHMKKLNRDGVSGIKTGINSWDRHTGGLQPSDLIIISGETSQGKTALALSIAYNTAVNQNAKVAIFSLEMSELQLTSRLVSIETKIPSKQLMFSPLLTYEWEKFNSKLNNLNDSAIYIDDCRSSNIDYIISGIKVAHMQHGIQVAIVDYLQLIKDTSKKTDESEIASNTRRLKNIAKELNITVILLSQLKRSDKPEPTIGRLRGSGQIEEAADLVVMIWRPELFNISTYADSPIVDTVGTAEVIIAKGRNYGVGKFYLKFDEKLTYFSNIDNYNTEESNNEQNRPF